MINRAAFDRLESDLANELEYQLEAGAEHDFLEGIDSFLGKRKAQLTGKP